MNVFESTQVTLNKFVNQLKYRKHYSSYVKTFGQIGHKPGFIKLLTILFLTFPPNKNILNLTTHKAILRHWKASRFPEDLLALEKDLPAIEILIVAAGKDLDLLPHALKSALENSLNPIVKLTVIIPNLEKVRCEQILSSQADQLNVNILLEDDLIQDDIRAELRIKFKERYGWVLQQLLPLEYILKSEAKGVLLLDADTILVRKVAWLRSNNCQKMMVTFDYHRPYYEVLEKLIECGIKPKVIFVPHHMLLQPNYLKEIFDLFNLCNVRELSKLLITYADERDQSPLCVDFELYAQGMMKLHRDKLELRKFSNAPVERGLFRSLPDLYKDYSNYNSVSLHHYLTPEDQY